MSTAIARPSYDAWVGVDHDVLRFVKALEAEINNLSVRLQSIEIEHREEIARRDRAIAEKDARIAKLEREVFLLREKANLTSRNSSKPPSSDPPSAPKRVPRAKGKRSRGGQPGYAFHARPLVPAEHVAAENIVNHKPEHCAACGHELEGSDTQPTRHQIMDLPVPTPLVIEHRLHRLSCSNCGSATCAQLPETANATGFGPGVEAVVATLWSACRLSHRMIVDTMRDLFGVEIAVGTVTNILSRVGRHVEAPVEAARQHVKGAEQPKHVDETGW